MPPKGGNAKKESGRAKKAENEAKKQGAAAAEKVKTHCHYPSDLQPVNPIRPQERKEGEKWSEGSKSSKAKEEREAKRREDLARKAENARLLADEEAAAPPKTKTAPKAGQKKAAKAVTPAGPGAIAAGGSLGNEREKKSKDASPEEVESYAATGIDNALELLEVVTAKMDKASVGQQAAGIERHPEVCPRRYLSHTRSFTSCIAEVQGLFNSGLYTIRNPQARCRQLSRLTKKQNFRMSKPK